MTAQNIALFNVARANLTQYVIRQAEAVRRVVGFGYVDRDEAPNTDAELIAAWEHSRKTGLAFPVWSGASENTIYLHRGGNYAFRFWHDAIHATRGLCMDVDDEVEIGMMHVKAVEQEFGVDSLEALLMFWDTVGQSMHCYCTGEFPHDQLAFVYHGVAGTIANRHA